MSNALLSAQELRELKRMCNDPFLELGMTLRPRHLECFKPKIATNSVMTVIKFQEHEDAQKWNKMYQDQICKGGRLATIALTALVYMIGGGPALSIAVGSTAAIVKDVVPAHIWYPKMYKGWLLTQYFTFRYEQFPGKYFYMQWTDVIQDETGKEKEKRSHGQTQYSVDGSSGIPEKIVRDLISKTPKSHMFSFK